MAFKTDEETLQRNRRYYWENREAILAQKRLSAYGHLRNFPEYALRYDDITECECCGKPFGDSKADAKCIDHSGAYIRGIICGSCNMGIGKLGDTMTGVNNALNYLMRYYGCL